MRLEATSTEGSGKEISGCTHCLLETDGCKEQVPALVPLLIWPSILYLRAEQGHTAHALLCRSPVGVPRALRTRDPHWQSVCTAPLPLAVLAGSSPSCMTVSVPPLYICTCLVSFPFLSVWKDNFIRNTKTKPAPWLCLAAQKAKSSGWLTREGIGLYILVWFRFLSS